MACSRAAVELEPWQRRFVEKFSRVNGDGERIYKRGMLGVARGSGKTPLAAGLALREIVGASDEPDVILAAAARDQARVCFEYARGFVESGPLAGVLQVGRHEIRNPLNGGVLRTVSADGFVAHGLNPSACVIDKLHAWSSGKVELFDALDTAIHKRPGAFWLVITTAGHDKTSLLGRLYGSMLDALELEETPGLVLGRDEWNGVLLHWYGAAEDADLDDRKLWRAVNPASFVTTEALRKQRNSPSMSGTTFARLHLNAWVAPDVERWMASDSWERLAGRVVDGVFRGRTKAGEQVETVPRLGYPIHSIHAVTGGGDEIVTPRPDRSVFAEFEVDVIHAVTPSTLADELAFRLVVLDGDLGDAFIDFPKG